MGDNMDRKLWKALHSLWIIPTVFIMINGFPLIYVGLRANKNKWIAVGTILEIPTIIFAIIVSYEITFYEDFLVILILLSAIISVIYALKIRNEYLQRIETISHIEEPIKNFNNLTQDIPKQHNTAPKSNEIIDTVTERAEEITQIPEEVVEQVDINKASVDELEKLPGVNIVLAKKIVNATKQGKQFKDIEDLAQYLNVSENLMKNLEKYLIFTHNETDINQRRLDL